MQPSPIATYQSRPRAGLVNRVTGNIKDNVRNLANNDPVYGLERISADAQSHGEIILNDDSRILVGPGAEISLDEFILADSGIQSATVNVLKGAFRFISGKSKQGTFKIKTPVSTIGIRGTLFDVYVGENGQTDVILFSGRVRVCSLANLCRDMRRTCDIVRVFPNRAIKYENFLRSGDRKQEDDDYNLINQQERFQKHWQVPLGSCYSRATLERLMNPGGGHEGEGPGRGKRGNGWTVGNNISVVD